MTDKWQKLDLGGGGLQAANLRLARLLRRRSVAYGLMLIFPLGAHRWYLGEQRSAALFPVLTAAALAGWLAGSSTITLTVLLVLGILLVWDLLTLENRIVAFNKRQRMAVYLSRTPGSGAPDGFRGRFDADAPSDSDTTSRMPTLAEQEAMLRRLAKSQSKNHNNSR